MKPESAVNGVNEYRAGFEVPAQTPPFAGSCLDPGGEVENNAHFARACVHSECEM